MLLPVIEGCFLHVNYNLYIPETNLSRSKNTYTIFYMLVILHVIYLSVNGKISN